MGTLIQTFPDGGGSGNGGHIIENQSGTDMNQRSNLQFLDAQAADDSTNDRTKIEIVKELQDESELASQPDGLYVLEDDEPIPDITKSDIGLGNVDNTSDATKKTNFTGSIASGNTGFVTGGDAYTALDNKISKSQTAGFVKNDGSIDTNTYAKSSTSNLSFSVDNDGILNVTYNT